MAQADSPSSSTPVVRAIGSGHLITRDTNFRIDSFNSATGVVLTIVVRSMGFDGAPIVDIFTHTPNTDRSIKTDTYYLSEGWLISAHVYASSGTPRRGQCFVRGQLIQGLTGATLSIATLCQGYVQDTTVLAYPGSEIQASTRGRGVMRAITGTNPAAGSQISETVPTNARWRLVSFMATMVTDATVANRTAFLIIDDGTTIMFQVGNGGTITASQTITSQWASGVGAFGSPNQVFLGTLPTDLHLPGGYRIRTGCGNFQAADDWGAPLYLVEEWIED